MKNWAKKLYQGLSVGANNCTECGECEPRCPYGLPIVRLIQEAQIAFADD
ncbi:MAG: 4Fe-4S dicluster domain-containing protein [Candidatus Freyarchaeota archaeon]